jgi:hypothetical protein
MGGCGKNVAVVERAALIVTVQVEAMPLHDPLHPENSDPAPGTAVRVTLVPEVKAAEQVAPQAMPAGLLVTVPDPAPAFVTVRG